MDGIRVRTRGYTLIEIAVTLAVVAILALIAVPSFNSMIKNHRLIAVTENLYNYLQYARSEAVKRNTNVYVSFVSGDNWCYGINTGSACNCTIANNCNLATVRADNAGQITLSTNSLSANSIYFEGSHGAANAAGSITYTLYGGSNLMTISVGRLGSLQLCATGLSGYTAC